MPNMDARSAYAAYSTGIQRVQEAILNEIQLGNVRPLYAETTEAVKGKVFRDWLMAHGLITNDPAFKKAGRGGGVGGKSYTKQVDELTGGEASRLKAAVKALNEVLKGTPYTAHFYTKSTESLGSRSKETPVPAPAA